MRDCYPMCCWWVMHFYVFLHDILYMRLSSGLAYLPLQGYRQLDVGRLGVNYKHPSWPSMFRTISCNKETTHSDSLSLSFPSVAIIAFRSNVLQEDYILCELYAVTRSDVSGYSNNESLDSDCAVPKLVHVNNCDILLVHWPHNFHTHFSWHPVGVLSIDDYSLQSYPPHKLANCSIVSRL
jgi:hypothetical protein